MTSRERVLRAIDHKETDRLPRNFRCQEELIGPLLDRLGLRSVRELEIRFKIDLQHVPLSFRCPYADGRNIWGMTFQTTGTTTNVDLHPLAGATTVEQVNAHAWPDPDWLEIDAFKKAAIEARKTGRAVVGSSWGSIFGESYRLMGMDNFMAAMALYPDVASAVIARVADFFMEVDRRLFDASGELIDLCYYGNDFGSQKGLLFSRQMLKDFFAPHIKRLIDQAKGYGLRAMYHSCGAVSELIDDLIDCGVDVLDPVQITAEGMEPRRLKDRFGDRICFHGAISAQRVLPLGTEEQVREHVDRICRIMKPSGGYIFTSDQQVTADTPVENIIAMYDAMDDFGY